MYSGLYRGVLRILVTAAFIGGGLYAWQHFGQAPAAPVAREEKTGTEAHASETESAEAKMAREVVTFRGPLADYVNQKPSEEAAPQTAPLKPSPKDRIIEDSPVGTSRAILHKTFALKRVAHVRFEIPPHAMTPRFCGTFRSLVGGETSHDDSANVDLLLLNEAQYADFAAGRNPDTLYVADTIHFRDINVDLSPSGDQPAHYYIVFRNPPGGADEKTVAADFRVDF
jgi:hypothetical protein